MQLAHQPSMWDVAEEAALTPLAGRVIRHELSRGAWVDHLPGWVTGSDEVLEVLLGDIGWREDRRQMYEREVTVPRLLRWYGDRIGRGRSSDTMVAIVSFGSPRPLLLRPDGGGAASLRFPLGHGDLVVMGGSCQRTWEHCIPKTAKPVGPRVSVQFRPAGVA
jgi:alkylated DNA repair dioxygenase AlkB